MSAVTPIRSVADTYSKMTAEEIGKVASRAYGGRRFDELVSDIRELCRLAKIAETAIAEGRIR